MKKRYLVTIVIAIVAIVAIVSYRTDLTSSGSGRLTFNREYKWSFTGASFITTYTDKAALIPNARTTHACLAGNDESCFFITVWTGNYASYFNTYWITMFNQMMEQSGSTVTNDDLKAQLAAGFNEVKTIGGQDGLSWHLVSIGMEQQNLYIERPWGTLIITDALGLKGGSYPDRIYINLTDIPKYLKVQ